MRKIKLILSLIGKKTIAKYMPQILAYLISKAMTYTLVEYPHKAEKVIETVEDISKATNATAIAARDGIITVKELEDIKRKWKEVFE